MASSRLERIGTIYSRITGLLRSGALKYEDKPIWYEIYEAFPPKNEPVSYETGPLPKILYPEDAIRAKFHKLPGSNETVDLTNGSTKTKSQKFIEIYQTLENEGNMLEEELFQAAVDKIGDQSQRMSTQNEDFTKSLSQADIVSSFKTAQKNSSKNEMNRTINLENVFKEN